MIQRQAFKYRLTAKPATELLMKQFAGCCRFVWNKALALQKERLDAGERTLGYNKHGPSATVLEDRPPVPERSPLTGAPAGPDEPGPGGERRLRPEAAGEALPGVQEEIRITGLFPLPAGIPDRRPQGLPAQAGLDQFPEKPPGRRDPAEHHGLPEREPTGSSRSRPSPKSQNLYTRQNPWSVSTVVSRGSPRFRTGPSMNH